MSGLFTSHRIFWSHPNVAGNERGGSEIVAENVMRSTCRVPRKKRGSRGRGATDS